MDFDTLLARWSDLSFAEFTAAAQQLGGVSSDKINGVITSVEKDKRAEQLLRFVIAMHFQLGRRAEFQLNDRSIATLLRLIHGATSSSSASFATSTQQPQAAPIATIAELAVALLTLNTAEYTRGVEQQLCAEFLASAGAPQRQLVLLPLVFRPFYRTLRQSSLSSGAFDALIESHALSPKAHVRLRLAALCHATQASMESFITTQLLRADLHGTRGLISSAPIAVGLDGKAARLFTVLHRNENMAGSQLHHCYLLAALRQHLKREGAALSADCCRVIVEYLQEIFAQITAACSQERCSVFATAKAVGFQFVEAVAAEAAMVAGLLCGLHRELGAGIAGDVSGLLYLALQVGRKGNSKLPAEEAPELHSYELVANITTAPQLDDVPHFSPTVILACLEFMVQTAPIDEVFAVFDDIFGPRLWQYFLAHHPLFPTQLCLVLLRNAARLGTLLPRIAPRVMWLLSQFPETLFPIVKRLLPHMMSDGTTVDLFCRIIMLPLLCFVNDHRPVFDANTVVDSELFVWELWRALDDWSVPDAADGGSGITLFAELCLTNQHAFVLWDALHMQLESMSAKMVCAFRLIRPLLAAYFNNSAALPDCIFDLIAFGYFFMVAPQEHKSVATGFLLQMGRWLVEARPQLAMAGIPDSFLQMIAQEHIPPQHRSLELQRFGCLAAAVALQACKDESAAKQAAVFFDATHELIWELMALASAEITEMSRGAAKGADAVHAASENLLRSSAPFSTNRHLDVVVTQAAVAAVGGVGVSSDKAPATQALAADFVHDSAAGSPPPPNWRVSRCAVWRSTPTRTVLRGVAFTHHMHSLVIALTLLTKRAPNLQERGVVCLANVVRTLQRATSSGFSLAATATLCMKFLRYPAMEGVETMPLRALVGVNGY